MKVVCKRCPCFSSIQFDLAEKPQLLVECRKDSCVDTKWTSLKDQQRNSIVNLMLEQHFSP